VAAKPTENRRLIGHPGFGTDGAEAFAAGEPVADCQGDFGAIIGRPTALGLDCHGDQAPAGGPIISELRSFGSDAPA
jgi:hypothetical protein